MKKNDRVKMSEDALENYGEEFKDVIFIISLVSHSVEDHPGYDTDMSPMGLYDLKIEDTGEDFSNSLYFYELLFV